MTWHDDRDLPAASAAFVTGVDTPAPHTAIIRLSQPMTTVSTKLGSSGLPSILRRMFEGTDLSANPTTTVPGMAKARYTIDRAPS